MRITLRQLANQFGCELFAKDENLEVSGFNALDLCSSNEISFFTDEKFRKTLQTTRACAVVMKRKLEDVPFAQLIHSNPYFAFAQMAQFLFKPSRPERGIHKLASVSPRASIHPSASIGPFCIVEDHVTVKENTILRGSVFLGEGVVVGRDCDIRANVVLEQGVLCGDRVIIHAGTVVGADGFGFAPSERGIAKIPQVGIVEIADDVEIGAGSTIDRAAFGKTAIGRGTKIDSSVHLGHNVQIGEDAMICGAVSVAGSAKIGSRTILAGQVGIANGVEICDGAVIAGRGGVTKNVTSPGQYGGFPLVPVKEWRKQVVYIGRLEELNDRVAQLEKRLRDLGVERADGDR